MDKKRNLKVVCFTSLENYSSTVIFPEIGKYNSISLIVIELPAKKAILKKFKWLKKYFGIQYTLTRIISLPFRAVVELFKKNKSAKRDNSIIEICKKNKFNYIIVDKINSISTKQILLKYDLDIGIICGTGIIKDYIFNIPIHGTLNFHSGIVPKYRGMDTIFWAIHNEDYENIGLTIHFVDSNIDTGPIVFQHRVKYKPGNSVDDIYKKCCSEGAELFVKALEQIKTGKLKIVMQSNDLESKFYKMATYKEKLIFEKNQKSKIA